MKYRNIKLFIIITSFSLGGLLITQLFWVRKAYLMSSQQFDHRVNLALNDVIADLQRSLISRSQSCGNMNDGDSVTNGKMCILESVDTSYLRRLLGKYTDYHRLDSRFEFAILRTSDDSMVYTSNKEIEFAKSGEIHKACLSCLCQRDTYHLALVFPLKNRFLFLDLSVWFILSGMFLIIVILSFSYIVFSFIRQKKISEIRDDFMNNMTHEFKTPISTISLASEVLLNADPESSVGRISKYARIIYDENLRMRTQVERVLQMAVLDRGEFQLKRSDINIHDLLKQTIHNLCLERFDKMVNVRYSFNAPIAVVKVDLLHMTNVISNLVENAIKYSTTEPELEIRTTNTNEGISIDFIDNGIGLSAESMKHVFDKFYRVPTGNKHNVKGFGLGLYYVKTVVEAHRGTVIVHSELNKGSRFTVFLPFMENS
jgi:two-component system, OmpR family, phosphate regulon sensor histidine kinase PhoR